MIPTEKAVICFYVFIKLNQDIFILLFLKSGVTLLIIILCSILMFIGTSCISTIENYFLHAYLKLEDYRPEKHDEKQQLKPPFVSFIFISSPSTLKTCNPS